MFLHNFKYAMRTTLKNKNTLIWTLLFPIVLSTLMYVSFGTLFEEEFLDVIPVAVVKEAENKAFETTLEELSKEGENQMLSVDFVEKEEAGKQLEEEKVKAILFMGEEIRLQVMENSYEATVLKTIAEEFEMLHGVITDIAVKNPQALEEVLNKITKEAAYFTKKETSDGNQDAYTNYFYAIFAMSCMFASFLANEKIQNIQANVSALGMRRCLSPNSKMTTILAEYTSMLLVQFVIELITLAYMVGLGIDFGGKYLQIILILFFGSCIGISVGVIIGSVTKLSKQTKEGLCVAIGMVLSVMADLVAVGIKYLIEQKVPFINKMNPCALIVDSFYALNIYDTYDRYIQNLTILGAMSALLVVISFFILRRNKYASL